MISIFLFFALCDCSNDRKHRRMRKSSPGTAPNGREHGTDTKDKINHDNHSSTRMQNLDLETKERKLKMYIHQRERLMPCYWIKLMIKIGREERVHSSVTAHMSECTLHAQHIRTHVPVSIPSTTPHRPTMQARPLEQAQAQSKTRNKVRRRHRTQLNVRDICVIASAPTVRLFGARYVSRPTTSLCLA